MPLPSRIRTDSGNYVETAHVAVWQVSGNDIIGRFYNAPDNHVTLISLPDHADAQSALDTMIRAFDAPVLYSRHFHNTVTIESLTTYGSDPEEGATEL